MRILLTILVCSSWVWAFTDEELIVVRDGFESRRSQTLDAQIADPYPDPATMVWGQLDFALAAFYQNTRLADANQAITNAYNMMNADPTEPENFHWHGNHLVRIYEFFAADSKFWPGRLTSDSEQKICELLYNWARTKSVLGDTETVQSHTWYVWGSENHDSQRDSVCWGAARILSRTAPYNTMSYDDGFTIAAHYDGWKKFYKEYFRERAKCGVVVEISSGYNPYTMMGWYNIYDFEDDATMRGLAGKMLDLYWADWAQEQIAGVRGGAKTRLYHENSMTAAADSIYSSIWFYLNIGTPRSKAPNQMMLATSGYRMPLIVMDMALDTQGRGSYEVITRKMGRNLIPKPITLDEDTYAFDPENGGLSKYTYCTPQYIMGTLFMNRLPIEEWTAVSSQNRWGGVIFAGHPDARIYPQCKGNTDSDKTMNDIWSVQSKGTMISQKLTTNKYAAEMRVFFASPSTALYRYEDSGWVFVDVHNCYAAVKPAYGGYYWQDENWMILREEYSPVVIEVGLKSDYANLTAFKTDVKDNTFLYDTVTGLFTYQAIQSRGTLTFHSLTADLPAVNNEPIQPQPSVTYQSPFINSQWRSGVIEITKDGRNLTLDFNPSTVPLKTDMNNDNVVDIYDFLIFGSYWLQR